MKTLKLLIISLILPIVFHAQNSLTGLWAGTLENDSNTVRKDQTFEIALTQYREKVYGYSRMNFIVNDTLYYIIKRVKGVIENDICEVKDDYVVKHNFPKPPEKGVKLVTTFRRNQQDSVWHLDGDWKTSEVLRRRYGYYSISGKISLKSEPDFEKSKLFPHLEELNLANDVVFYKESKKNNQSVIATSGNSKISDNTTNSVSVNKKDEAKKQVEDFVAKTDFNKTNKPINTSVVTDQNNSPAAETVIPVTNGHETVDKKEEETEISNTSLKKVDTPATTLPEGQKKDVAVNSSRPEIKKQELPVKKIEPVVNNEETEVSRSTTKKSDLVTVVKPSEEKKIYSETKAPPIKIPSAAAFVQERKTAASQVVTFKSDSLELALYDNGEVDGDTVSVLLNGEIFLAKQGLKAAAIKKTIYVQPGTEEVTLVLYAENLGKYPPNTGLLVVHDGDDTYQVRFSADLQQNASVVFRRKK